MDNENFNIEDLQALLAGVYSGGNSWAARSARARLQRRDDEGKFAEMFGTMRLVMLLNGLPVAGYGKYVGASTRKGPNGNDNMGWVYINPDKNFPNGKFVRVPMDKVNMFDGRDGGVALLGEDYLKEKGIDPKNPSFTAGMLNFDELESQDYPPGFLPSPSVGGAFISEDGDISIEPDGKGGWDVIDNLDREAPVRNVATLADALEQVYEIDKTRTNYDATEGGTKTPETPVAELPTTDEAPKADPAGMTNKALGEEVARFERIYGGRTTGMDEPTKARYDAVDAEWELRLDEHEDQFENPDFVRDPSKSEATAPVATIPTTATDADAIAKRKSEIAEENSKIVAELAKLREARDAAGGTLSDADQKRFDELSTKRTALLAEMDAFPKDETPVEEFEFDLSTATPLDGSVNDAVRDAVNALPESLQTRYLSSIARRRQQPASAEDVTKERAIFDEYVATIVPFVVARIKATFDREQADGNPDAQKNYDDAIAALVARMDSDFGNVIFNNAAVEFLGNEANIDQVQASLKKLRSIARAETPASPVAEIPTADAFTPDEQKSLDDFAEKLAGMSNSDVLDEGYEISNAYERLDMNEAEPSAFLEAQRKLVNDEYAKRQAKMQEESPDPNNYFRDGNIARGYHNYDNNTRFYYSEDVEGNITYGMENYTPDGGLANEDIREAKTIEEARKNVIAMIDAFGEETGVPDLPTYDGTFDQYGEIVERSDLDEYPNGSIFYVNKNLANGMLVQKRITKVDDGFGLSHWEDERGNRLVTPEDFDEYFPPTTDPEINKQILEIQAESIVGEGTTYSILGADAPTDGYMVSHKAIVDPVDKDVFEGEGGKRALFDFIKKAQELGFFQSDNEFVGVWLDTGTNKYYLDVSENVKDLDEAKRLGEERDQIAIWDVVNNVAINVGGTGEREETDSGAKPDGQDGSRDSGSGEPPVGGPAGEVDPEDGAESIDELLARLDLVNDPDFISKAVEVMFDPENAENTIKTDEYEFGGSVSIDQIMQEGSFDGFLEVFDPQGGDSQIFEISFPMSGFESLGEQYTRAQMAQKIKEALAEAGVGTVQAPLTPADAVDSVNKSLEDGTPIVAPDVVPATPVETVSEVSPAPELAVGGTVINGTPTSAVVRRAKQLDDVSEADLQDALADAIDNEKSSVRIDGKSYPTTVLVAALSGRGFDTDMFIAEKLDEKNGNTENVDALNAYRNANADVIGVNGEQGDQDPVDTFLKNASRDKLTSLYLEAVQNGRDSVAINLEDFGAPAALGPKMTEISVADFRKKLEDAGIDVDSLDNGFQDNEDVKQEIAEELGLPVDREDVPARTDWRQVIRSNDREFIDVFYYTKKGDYRHFERRDDGLWYKKNSPNGGGISNDALIRKMDREADPNRNIEIDNGEPQDEETDYAFYDANNIFRLGGPEGEFVEGAPPAPVIRRMMNVVGADASQIEAEEKAGRPVDIMDAVRERFPNAQEGDDGELITEVHEWTGPDGTKYRYEVVVVRTADEYFYTYIRQTNLTENVAWSARLGVISQSATALFNAYNTNVGTFLASFLRPGGPVGWMENNARKKSRRREVWDEEAKKWVHLKEIKNNPQTRANLKILLGETPATNAQVRAAEDKFFEDILDGVTKWRMNDRKLQIFAKDKGVTLDYLYRVIGAYDAHLANQANIEGYGTWISYDQKTPLDAGDVIEHESGRRGVVRKRIGFVDSLGRYRYTDYVEVRWDNGDISWTTSRKNKLIRTADGTDGSERINYKNAPSDPRAEKGTSLKDPDNASAPQGDPLPANAPKQVRAVATRNENSELVLPDGTVVPELTVSGGTFTHTAKQAKNLEVGDFIGTLNSDMEYVSAPVLGAPVLSEDGSKYNVDVVVRESDGTYSVNTLSFPASDRQQVLATTQINNDTENSATPAQLNEVLELLGSKEIPAGFQIDALLRAYSDGYVTTEAVQYTLSSAEIADIIQELRALPERESTPVQDLADFARQASDDAARSGNAEAAENFEFLADAGDVIASQSPSAEAPNEGEAEPDSGEPASVERMKADFEANKDVLDMFRDLEIRQIGAMQNALQKMFNNGEIDYIQYRWASRYINRAKSKLDRVYRLTEGRLGRPSFERQFEAMNEREQDETRFLFQDTMRLLNNLHYFVDDRIRNGMVADDVPGAKNLAKFLAEVKKNPIKFKDDQVAGSYSKKINDSYGDEPSARRDKANALLDAYSRGYTVEEIQGSSSESPSQSQNEVIFVTLSDGSRAVLKYLSANELSEAINELTAGRTHEEIGLATPATTVVVGPNGEEALLIEFVPSGAIQAIEFAAERDEIYEFKDAPKLAVMDLIAGNADRHDENWFYNPETDTIYPIDHGLGYNITGIDSIEELEKWISYLENNEAWYPGFGDIINDFINGDNTDKVTTSLLTDMESRISSLRDMYVSMGMLEAYEQLLTSLNVLLGISRY